MLDADNNSRTALSRLSHGGIARGEQKDLNWKPIYSTVSGNLLKSDLPVISTTGRASGAFARFALDARTAGDASLKFSTTAGLQIWLDGVSVNPAQELKLALTQGRHQLIIALDPEKTPDSLQIQLLDSSTSRVELPTGP